MIDNRHISRLKAMLEDCGDTWDLSTNDKAAIQHVVDRLAELDREKDEMARDAERWRECERLVEVDYYGDWVLINLDGDTFAAAIDAEIAKRKDKA